MDIKDVLLLLEQKREKLLDLTKDLTIKQYNLIPAGFNNNIIWNMGHLMAVSERILYTESGFDPPNHPFLLKGFHRGTSPEAPWEENAVRHIRQYLINSVRYFESRGEPQIPSDQMAYDTAKINTGRLNFLLLHEDYHYDRIADQLSSL